MLESADLRGAYHGILPRGLAPSVEGTIGPAQWASFASVLDRWLDRDIATTGWSALAIERCQRRGIQPPPEESLTNLLTAARDAEVLSFRDSTVCAFELAAAHADELLGYLTGWTGPTESIDLWCVKEGHTASVWRIELHAAGGRASGVFALNVARDRPAGIELEATASELCLLRQLDPAGVVAVLAVYRSPVVAIACNWVEGRELHVIKDDDGRGRFVAVECFAQRPAGRMVTLGERLTAEQSDTIWGSWLRSLIAQSRLVPGRRTVLSPRVELNEGDLVLAGRQPVLVALTPGPREADVGEWTIQLLTLQSGEREPRIKWGKPAVAWAQFRADLAARPKDGCDAERCREGALLTLNACAGMRPDSTEELRETLRAD